MLGLGLLVHSAKGHLDLELFIMSGRLRTFRGQRIPTVKVIVNGKLFRRARRSEETSSESCSEDCDCSRCCSDDDDDDDDDTSSCSCSDCCEDETATDSTSASDDSSNTCCDSSLSSSSNSDSNSDSISSDDEKVRCNAKTKKTTVGAVARRKKAPSASKKNSSLTAKAVRGGCKPRSTESCLRNAKTKRQSGRFDRSTGKAVTTYSAQKPKEDKKPSSGKNTALPKAAAAPKIRASGKAVTPSAAKQEKKTTMVNKKSNGKSQTKKSIASAKSDVASNKKTMGKVEVYNSHTKKSTKRKNDDESCCTCKGKATLKNVCVEKEASEDLLEKFGVCRSS